MAARSDILLSQIQLSLVKSMMSKLAFLFDSGTNTWKERLSYYDDNWAWFGIGSTTTYSQPLATYPLAPLPNTYEQTTGYKNPRKDFLKTDSPKSYSFLTL
jgi:hypothetical protein